MPLIEVGAKVPEFSLQDQHGKWHALSDYRGRIVVLYFYPEDDTPLCTAQACQFRDHHPDFAKIKAAVIGISPQDSLSKARFAAGHALPFTLLADPARPGGSPPVSSRLGAWREKSMYGNKVVSIVRTTYLIDAEGRVARRWDSVKTPGHAAAVLAAVKALHKGESPLGIKGPRPVRSAQPRQRTRTQAGHAGYSGVSQSRGKKTAPRAAAVKNRTRSAVRASGATRTRPAETASARTARGSRRR